MKVAPEAKPPNDMAQWAERDRRRLQREKNQVAIDLLDSWCDVSDEDAEEQRETLEYLIRALDIDRPSDRLLFPWEWNEDACPARPASEWRVPSLTPTRRTWPTKA